MRYTNLSQRLIAAKRKHVTVTIATWLLLAIGSFALAAGFTAWLDLLVSIGYCPSIGC